MTISDVFKVLVPVHRPGFTIVKFSLDLIFINDVPFAVLEWSGSTRDRSPSVMVKLETRHLRENVSGYEHYEYEVAIEVPRLPTT